MGVVIPGRTIGTLRAVAVSDTVANLRMDSVSAHYLTNQGTSAATCPIDALDSTASPAYTLIIQPSGTVELSPYAVRVRSTGSVNVGSLIAEF